MRSVPLTCAVVAAWTTLGLTLSASADEPGLFPEYRGELAASDEASIAFAGLLEAGYDRRNSLSDVKQLERQVSSDLSADPSLDYARALILLKRNEFDDALDALEEARGSAEAPYIPAWKATLWNLMVRRKYAEGFELLTEFARLQERLREASPEATAPAENVQWIGRLLGGLEYQITRGAAREQYQQAYVDIERLLCDEHRAVLQAGVDEVFRRHDEIMGKVSEQKAETAEQQKQENQQKQQELTTQQSELDKEQQELKLTAAEWSKKLEDALINFGKKIGSLERDYGLLEARRQSLQRSINLVGQELTALQIRQQLLNASAVGQTPIRKNLGTDPQQNQLLREITLRQQQLAQYEGQYNQTLQGMNQVRAEAMQVFGERQALVNEYQKATGQLVKQDKQLEKLASKLQKDEQDLKEQKADGESRETKRLRSRIRYLSTYVTFDLDEERQRLIVAHTPPTPQPPAEEQP